MAKELDGQVADFRHRPLDGGPYTFVAADALVLKVRRCAKAAASWACMPSSRPASRSASVHLVSEAC